ncbi:hypothetical protein Bca4012_024123 [Brassica carinata]|uniref:RING-type E3 ubiquitin transferase n=1 Tax=Brassica carinata TaxID=52824 RepID=A0A8X7UP44_BRACI|nr:hypothetical protein Bca52824_055921 [Brassica carinata]
MAKLFGCPINVQAEEEEEDGGGTSIAVEVSRSGNQSYGEATSFSAGLPPSNQREETNQYFWFLDSNSDSGSVSMESESDLHHCFIDFFDRESYVASNQQRLSTSYDFDIWGIQDMEEEIELGLRVGSGSDDSGGLRGVPFTEIDTGRVEVETGRVEVETGRVEFETGRVEVETGRVEVEVESMVADEAHNAITWDSEPVEANLLLEEEVEGGTSLFLEPMDYDLEYEPMDREWPDRFFDDLFDSPVGVFLTSIDEYADNHGDYEDVLARSFDESGTNGSPPASKRVVDELPDVEITSGELSIGCAICKDEIVVEEKVKRLPCKHYYHKECIVPWLGIRNTCPVCRYELPTDDLEYERNRRRSQRRGGSSGVEVIMDDWFWCT